MARPDHDRDWSRWQHPNNPAKVITQITTAARAPVASATYRRLMTVIDADVFTRPDYPEFVHLAHVLTVRHARREQP